ncbi:unnamed protein product [Linum tenue]|uniref:Uncharacterized protein n=1 Tax=Linum tenue TaxID=586396 RepID=A0AAV0L4J7_9ROSI|nr:unnamed protein product [Linum tenue]
MLNKVMSAPQNMLVMIEEPALAGGPVCLPGFRVCNSRFRRSCSHRGNRSRVHGLVGGLAKGKRRLLPQVVEVKQRYWRALIQIHS